MFDSTTARDDAYEGRALVAAFPDRDAAHDAAHRLQAEGFHRIWLGITHPADAADDLDRTSPPVDGETGTNDNVVVETANDSFGDRIGRFFNGRSGQRGLHDELVRHGVDAGAAASIERSIAPGSAILTLDGSNHPEMAAHIVEDCGGHLLAGEGFDEVADRTTPSTKDDLRGSDVLGYGEPTKYARGAEIDEERRIRLRTERLDVAKQRESAGVASVGTDVVAKQNEMDVPVMHEELFVERRATSATDSARADTTAIGETATISIPLMRERVVVTKRPVVTDEYVIGKRQVGETQHISETTREEKLVVDDATASTGDRSTTDTSAGQGVSRTMP